MKKDVIKILFIADIFGKPGRDAVRHFLPLVKNDRKVDLVIANGENLASGSGLTFEKYKEMMDIGVDYMTTGNHVWNKKEITDYLKENKIKVLRPENYPFGAPGKGVVSVKVGDEEVVIANLLGRVFIPDLVEDPFVIAKNIIDNYQDRIIVIDFHAEATSEKAALGHFLDGQVSAVLGTHTHVQTADEKILPNGTAFISDVGMCGPIDSVIGVKKQIIVKQFLTGLPQSFKVASGDSIFNACLVEIDRKTKKALKIERINKTLKRT